MRRVSKPIPRGVKGSMEELGGLGMEYCVFATRVGSGMRGVYRSILRKAVSEGGVGNAEAAVLCGDGSVGSIASTCSAGGGASRVELLLLCVFRSVERAIFVRPCPLC